MDEIKGLINKISNVKQISGFTLHYLDESGKVLSDDEVTRMMENLDTLYYEITLCYKQPSTNSRGIISLLLFVVVRYLSLLVVLLHS